jgi:hypothetical protein
MPMKSFYGPSLEQEHITSNHILLNKLSDKATPRKWCVIGGQGRYKMRSSCVPRKERIYMSSSGLCHMQKIP